MDRRRRQWVPLSVDAAHGSTGTRLLERFGRDGLLVWILYLAACKRNAIQGQLDYASEPDGWTKLGLYGIEPEFTLEEFFRYTGQLKQTSRRRVGRIVKTTCSQWRTWNDEIKRERDASQKRSIREGNTDDVPAPMRRRKSADAGDREGEGERHSSKGRKRSKTTPREPGDLNGLPVSHEQAVLKILKAVGDDADAGTAATIRRFAGKLPEGSLAKVAESVARSRRRHRGEYAVGALRSELEERKPADVPSSIEWLKANEPRTYVERMASFLDEAELDAYLAEHVSDEDERVELGELWASLRDASATKERSA